MHRQRHVAVNLLRATLIGIWAIGVIHLTHIQCLGNQDEDEEKRILNIYYGFILTFEKR